jgi:plasmid stabilization system protein ParE
VTAVRFLPAAEIELLREVAYYSKAQSGAGVRFQAAVEAALVRASHHPLGGAPSFKETRSVLVKGFSFSIVYRASAHQVLVVAVAPHRKRPQYWSGCVE